MTGRLYIDGIDAYRQFGVFIAKGGYDELLSFPPLKEVTSIDWQEEDGKEFDLAAPVLDTQELSIAFAMQGVDRELVAFVAFVTLLANGAYHVFEFPEIGRTCKLRLVSQSNLTLGRELGLFTLRFADDFPLKDYTYKAPASTLVAHQGYGLDGVSLSEYGVSVIKGSLEEIEKIPAVKKNMSRDIKSQAGVIYDGAAVRFKTKDVKLTCLMRARTLYEFWHNYDALIFDLIRPGERRFSANSVEYLCYYKSCSTVEFALAGVVWFKFSLSLVFTLNERN